jgi:hypothetical protein
MPSRRRDPDAPAPNRPRKAEVCFIVELDGGVLTDRRSGDGAFACTGGTLEDGESVADGPARELRVVDRANPSPLPLAPVHRQIRDAYLAFDGTVVGA